MGNPPENKNAPSKEISAVQIFLNEIGNGSIKFSVTF